MTTRRAFLTGLLGSAAVAAIGPAQAVPAQPVADFLGWGCVPYGSNVWGDSSLVRFYGQVRGEILEISAIPSILRGAA